MWRWRPGPSARRPATWPRPLEAGDLDLARRRLPTLVGRDPAGLGAAEITRAVVESVAENTVDAVIAPAVWVALAGPAGGLAYRALNTGAFRSCRCRARPWRQGSGWR